EESARRIAASAIREQLLAALGHWSTISGSSVPDHRRKLWALARLADSDPYRQEIFAALEQRDAGRGARLAQPPEALSQPPARLVVLAGALASTDVPAAVEFLRQAHQRYSRDFWIHHDLAHLLMRLKPPELDEAIGFFRVAVALRPESPGA